MPSDDFYSLGIELPTASPLHRTAHEFVRMADPSRSGCCKCGLPADALPHAVAAALRERLAALGYGR